MLLTLLMLARSGGAFVTLIADDIAAITDTLMAQRREARATWRYCYERAFQLPAGMLNVACHFVLYALFYAFFPPPALMALRRAPRAACWSSVDFGMLCCAILRLRFDFTNARKREYATSSMFAPCAVAAARHAARGAAKDKGAQHRRRVAVVAASSRTSCARAARSATASVMMRRR